MLLSSNPGLILALSFSLIKFAQSGPSVWLSGTYSQVGDGVPSLMRRKISDSNSHPKVLADIHNLAGCPGEICGTLSGDAVTPLLAGAGECAQQDMADKIIDTAKSKLQDKTVQNKLIELAKIYRQTERNTFPDFSSPSSPDRNSLYCQKAPRNSELSGLFQKQSSNADPKLFFDPKANGKSIQKGSDPRTIPFGQSEGDASSGSIGTNDRDDAPQPDAPSRKQTDSVESTSSSNNPKLRSGNDEDSKTSKKKATASKPRNKSDEDDDDDDDDDDDEIEKSTKDSDESTQAPSKATVSASGEDRLGVSQRKHSKKLTNGNDETQTSTDTRSSKNEPDESSEGEKPVVKSNRKKNKIGKCRNKRRVRTASR